MLITDYNRQAQEHRSDNLPQGRGSVRITSGEYKGRKIVTPGHMTHPMGAREKLALFNTIAPHVAGARVLDLYSGSGALGLEALSRGAREAVLVEQKPPVAATIRKNIALLGPEVESRTTVERMGAAKFLSVASTLESNKFDIIIADPPYKDFGNSFIAEDSPFQTLVLNRIPEFLAQGGVFVLSHPELRRRPYVPGMRLVSSRKYAAAYLAVFERASGKAEDKTGG